MEKAFIMRNNRAIGMDVQKVYTSTPVGIIQPFASDTNIPRGYLLCDGASYKVAEYPDLYAVIGNIYGGDSTNFNVPDYRETVLVGVGENTTDTIASHDVYELGEFKDDQLQDHTHTINTGVNTNGSYIRQAGTYAGAEYTTSSSTIRNGRTGTTTHGKQKGVTYIIKAFHTNEGTDEGVSDDVIDYVEGEIAEVESEVDKITYSTDANECIPALMKTARYNLINTSANVPNSNYSWVLTAEHIKLSTGQYYRIIQDINGTKSDGGTVKYTRTATSTDNATWTWTDWVVDALISDTTSSTTSTYSSKKIDEKYGAYTFGTADATQWLKLTLGNSSKFQPIVISDQYGGKVEITGMADDGIYKPVKLIRYSYGDWNTYSATDYTLYDGVDPNYKIQRLFYYPTNGCYYLEIRQWCTIKVSGAISKPEMVTSLPAETSAMTLIPESRFATKKDIDGTFIKTTTTTGSEYYGITFKDKQFERGNNQGILIQHNRLNFEPVTFIFSASSYNTAAYERDNYDVTKINGAVYNPTSPYMMQFYMDKTNNTLYLSVPSYSGVALMDLQFKSDAITYTKIDAIPDTATKITVTEYVTKNEMPTTRSLTLKSDYSGYITEIYDPTTKVVVYNVNVSGTFKGLLNSVADGFRVPKGSTSSSDVMHQTIGIYGSNSAMTGDAQFTRLLVRNYGNPHLEVDVSAENTVVSGTITYVTA